MMEFYARGMEPPPRERKEWEENHPIEVQLAKAQKTTTRLEYRPETQTYAILRVRGDTQGQ
jgi:hypothetical protein